MNLSCLKTGHLLKGSTPFRDWVKVNLAAAGRKNLAARTHSSWAGITFYPISHVAVGKLLIGGTNAVFPSPPI